MVLESWLLHFNGFQSLFTTRVLLYKVLAEGYMHIQVKTDSYVNMTFSGGFGEIACSITQPGMHNAAKGTNATEAAKAETASQSEIRGLGKTSTTLKSWDYRNLQLSKIAWDPTGGLKILLFTAPHNAANSFHSVLLLSALSYLNSLGLQAVWGCLEIGIGPALPCSEARRAGACKYCWRTGVQHLPVGVSSPASSSKASAVWGWGCKAGTSECLFCTLQCQMVLFLSKNMLRSLILKIWSHFILGHYLLSDKTFSNKQ